MIYLAIAVVAVGMFAFIQMCQEELDANDAVDEAAKKAEGPHWAGWGVDMTDQMAAEYRYEQAQQHA